MIPSIVLEGRLMLSYEIDYCEDYFSACETREKEGNTQDDTGLIVGYQALLVL